MTKKKYIKPEIKEVERDPITEKINVMMNEVKNKCRAKLNINLNSQTNYTADNKFDLRIDGYNNVDVISETSTIYVSQKLITDLLIILYHHKKLTVEYSKKLHGLKVELVNGNLSQNDFTDKINALKAEYMMLN